jgi:hypothetical protein
MSATPPLFPPATDPHAPPPPATASAFEVLKPKQPSYLGVEFKVRATGRLFRLRPIRCPDQPRFWCFEVRRCLQRETVDPHERPWIGANRLRRDELPTAITAIQVDLDGWLAQPGQGAMRAWIFDEPEAT